MKLFVPSLMLASLLVLVPMNAEAKTFDNGNYKFEFPNGCKMDKKEENRFSTANAILECKGDASLQFESDPETSARFTDDSSILDSMKTVFETNYDNADIVESGTDKYLINNKSAPYVIGTYDQGFTNFLGLPAEPEPYVLMYVMVDIGGEKVLVQYRNTEDDFDKQLPMAENIFKSVEGIGDRTAIAKERAETYNFPDDPEFENICNGNPNEQQKLSCDLVKGLKDKGLID